MTPLKEPLVSKVLYSPCSVTLCQYTVLLEKTGLISSKPLPSAFIRWWSSVFHESFYIPHQLLMQWQYFSQKSFRLRRYFNSLKKNLTKDFLKINSSSITILETVTLLPCLLDEVRVENENCLA